MEQQEHEVQHEDDKFFPKGAIAFFLILIILISIIWFAIYFIMVYRA